MRKQPTGPTGLLATQPARQTLTERFAVPKALDDAVTLVEEALGGRQKLLEALAFAESTPLVSRLLGLLGDPEHDVLSLAQICARGNLTPGDLLAAYRQAKLGIAQALATQAIADKLPEVTADVMLRATPHEVECPTCRGVGTIQPKPTKKDPHPEPESCPTCQGQQYIGVLPDLDRQKVALDLGQLIPKSPGVSVQMQQTQQTLNASTGNLAELQQAVGDLMYGSARNPDSEP